MNSIARMILSLVLGSAIAIWFLASGKKDLGTQALVLIAASIAVVGIWLTTKFQE